MGVRILSVPTEVMTTGVTVLIVTMIMYVVDWIADQRERRRNHELRMNENAK